MLIRGVDIGSRLRLVCVCVWGGGLFGFVCGVGDIVRVKTYRIWFGKLYKLWTAGERNRMGLWVGESI